MFKEKDGVREAGIDGKTIDVERIATSIRRPISLDGEWSFQFGDEAAQTIAVPGPWEASRNDLVNKAGSAVYERSFTVPDRYEDQRVVLRFGAADYFTEVWVNGEFIGTHEGGYTPFEFEIQNQLRLHGDGAEHSVRVRVTDSSVEQDATLPDGEKLVFAEIPHGKQSWYTSVSGLWQSVSLETRPLTYIESVTCLPDIDRGYVGVTVVVAETVELKLRDWQVRVQIEAPPGAAPVTPFAAELAWEAVPGEPSRTLPLELAVPDAALWSPDSPALYRVLVTLERQGAVVDAQARRFGMRKIETKDGLVWLNNRPVFLAGALDQDFYPRTIYTPPSDEFLRDEFVKAKELGLNLMRCHIKVPTERYLDLCDEIGLLVWYELPNGARLSPAFRKRGRQTLLDMRRRDVNHPCIVILTIMNESWGIDLTDGDQRQWLGDTYRWAKDQFSGWLVVDNSPCIPNFHVESDLDDYHIYFNIPDQADQFAAWTAAFANGSDGTYSAYGDADRRGTEPIVLSEFGNWGLPRLDGILKAEGGEPWWFKTGRGATRPEGVLDRFKKLQLQRAFSDYDALADASQEQQWLSLKWEIEEMRLHPQIAGYVITEFTDLNWECNGLLDMARCKKAFHDRMAALQAQDILIPRVAPRTALWEGETTTLRVALSSFSGVNPTGGTVHWAAADCEQLHGSQQVAAAGQGAPDSRFGTHDVAEIRFQSPHCASPCKHEIALTLKDAAGATIATCRQNVVFAPAARRRIACTGGIWLHDPIGAAPNLAGALERSGLQVHTNPVAGNTAIATRWDDAVAQFAQAGGSVLMAASTAESLAKSSGLGIGLADRSTNGWWGDWCTTKIWFVPELFPSIPDTVRFDFEFQAVVPKRVLTGVPAECAVAGLFAGWLRRPAALVARIPVGRGTLVVTTFDVLPHIGEDPIATLMFSDLIALAAEK